jgi:LysM repeat protein
VTDFVYSTIGMQLNSTHVNVVYTLTPNTLTLGSATGTFNSPVAGSMEGGAFTEVDRTITWGNHPYTTEEPITLYVEEWELLAIRTSGHVYLASGIELSDVVHQSKDLVPKQTYTDHKVLRGENLQMIADKYGMEIEEIRNLNPRLAIYQDNYLRPGWKLKVFSLE